MCVAGHRDWRDWACIVNSAVLVKASHVIVSAGGMYIVWITVCVVQSLNTFFAVLMMSKMSTFLWLLLLFAVGITCHMAAETTHAPCVSLGSTAI